MSPRTLASLPVFAASDVCYWLATLIRGRDLREGVLR